MCDTAETDFCLLQPCPWSGDQTSQSLKIKAEKREKIKIPRSNNRHARSNNIHAHFLQCPPLAEEIIST